MEPSPDERTVPVNDPLLVIDALFVGHCALEVIVKQKVLKWKEEIEDCYEVALKMQVAHPPFETDDLETKGCWLKPDGHTHEGRGEEAGV